MSHFSPKNLQHWVYFSKCPGVYKMYTVNYENFEKRKWYVFVVNSLAIGIYFWKIPYEWVPFFRKITPRFGYGFESLAAHTQQIQIWVSPLLATLGAFECFWKGHPPSTANLKLLVVVEKRLSYRNERWRGKRREKNHCTSKLSYFSTHKNLKRWA